MPRMTPLELAAWEARMSKRDPAQPDPDAAAPGTEDKLQNAIAAECDKRKWAYVWSRRDRPTTQRKGVPDFIIFASRGRVLQVECKTKTGKLSRDQQGWIMQVEKDGHVVHVVRSLRAFWEVVG